MRTTKALLIALLALIAIAAGVLSQTATAAKPRRAHTAGSGHVNVYTITPSSIQASVSGPDNPDVAMVGPRSHWNNELLVFLPGTGGQPQCCEQFLRTAVSLGYHVVALTYDNQTAVGDRCGNHLNCYQMVRENEFNGNDRTPWAAFPASDGIDDRLAAVLRYLNHRYKHEGWGRYLIHRYPRWSRIVMSGHSQGGGEAAFIGTIKALRGVVTLSSPPDTNSSYEPPSWLDNVPTGRTPLKRIIAFVHAGDEYYQRIVADWRAMQLQGPFVDIEQNVPPYGNSHELVSTAPLTKSGGSFAHESTAVDNATPMCPNGTPEYTSVWSYMLITAGGLHKRIPQPACSG